MSLICLLFFVGFIGAAYVVFSLIWFAFLCIFKIQRKKIGFLISIPTFIAGILTYFFVVTSPSYVFEKSFGFPPTEPVTDLKSDYSYWADSGHTFLRFKAPSIIIKKIVSRGLQTTKFPTIPASNVPMPLWFIVPDGKHVTYYAGNFKGRDFANESEFLAYDTISQTAFFCFLGID